MKPALWLCSLLLLLPAVQAAPAKKRVVNVAPWEYCLVESPVYEGNSVGVMVHLPDGRQIFQVPQSRFVELSLLNRLGNSGWEVVGSTARVGSTTWTLKRRK
jgi:hypothetical protein